MEVSLNKKKRKASRLPTNQSTLRSGRRREPTGLDSDNTVSLKKPKLNKACQKQRILVLKPLGNNSRNPAGFDPCSSSNSGSSLDQISGPLLPPKRKNITIGQKFIAVDNFTVSDLCKYHFLTHAHPDRLMQLNSKWKEPIYCSELTARILPIVMRGDCRVNLELLRPLKVGWTHSIDHNLKVTVLDANHCPGSVMYLFEGTGVPGGAVLCTGDFRADSQMMESFEKNEAFHRLANTLVDNIYFDNTYLSYPMKTFIERKESTTRLVLEIEKLLGSQCLVLIPIYNLGREEAIESLSERTGEVISMNQCRLQIHAVMHRNSHCNKTGIAPQFSDDSDEMVRIRVIPRNIRLILRSIRRAKVPVVIIDLSLQNDLSSYQYPKSVKFIQIPYSDHCSGTEIRKFLTRINFRRIMPIYNSLYNKQSEHPNITHKEYESEENTIDQNTSDASSLDQYITNAAFMNSSYFSPSLPHDCVIEGVDVSNFAPLEITVLPRRMKYLQFRILANDASQKIFR